MGTLRTYIPDERVSFVEADGTRFGYLSWGEGPLVLLFHGFPDSAYAWTRMGPTLAAAGYRVVAPFLRGYAPSAIPDRDTTVERLGRDVLALIKALGAERARIVGHDWGAEAVYAAASMEPDRIERLVTIGLPHRRALRLTPGLFWLARHFLTLRLPGAERRFAADDYALLETFCRRWSPGWTPPAEDLEPTKNIFAAPGTVHSALGYYRAVDPRTPAYFKRKLAMPTLCIGGTSDPALDEADFARTARYCANDFRLAMIPGGHFCHRESEAAFLAAVLPFMQ
jgi:pimeloyl-ACP methyl ester carboxylesterase